MDKKPLEKQPREDIENFDIASAESEGNYVEPAKIEAADALTKVRENVSSTPYLDKVSGGADQQTIPAETHPEITLGESDGELSTEEAKRSQLAKMISGDIQETFPNNMDIGTAASAAQEHANDAGA